MVISDLSTRYTLSDNWILRNDPYCSSKEYSVYDINSRMKLYVTRACYVLLKIFSRRALSFSELCMAAEKKNVKIDWDGFENLCKKIAPLEFLVKSEVSLNNSDIFVPGEGVCGNDVPVASTPFSAELHFTHRCNLKCKHCFQNSSPDSNLYHEIDSLKWIDIFGQIESCKMHNITLSGGEIMVYPQFSEVFNEIVKRKISFIVLTNGILINSNSIEALSKKNVSLTISLDGHSEEIHDKLRGRGTYERVIKNVKLLVEHSAKVTLAYTINSFNYMYLRETVELARSLKVKELIFSFTSEIGRAKDNSNLILSKLQRDATILNFSHLKEEYEGIIELSMLKLLAPAQTSELSDQVFCTAGTTHVGISPDGKLYPCVYGFGYDELVMGDLTQEKLKDIWENREKWKLFRGGFSLDKIDTCATCVLNRRCSLRNCRLMNYSQGKSFYNKPLECAIDYSFSL